MGGGKKRHPLRFHRRLPATVWAAGLVSLLTDVSTEMIVPVLPLFVTETLHAGAGALGLLEGVAESTASVLRVASGWFSDRIGRRKPLMLAGYGFSNLVKPLFALSTSWTQVLGIRFLDRFGKGIRGAPRDALLAEVTPPEDRGRSFGLHRALDTLGAALGPLLAAWLLASAPGRYRTIFWVSAIPGTLAVLILLFAVREPAPDRAAPAAESWKGEAAPGGRVADLGGAFLWLLAAATLFSLGNSSDAFLILKARSTGLDDSLVPLAYFVLNAVYSAASFPMGALSDRVGRFPLVLGGWVAFALIYAGFALASRPRAIWLLFAVYGVYYASTEGMLRALAADLVPAPRRATALGLLNGLTGLALLPASVVAGWLWQSAAPAAVFWFGAATALGAVLFLLAGRGKLLAAVKAGAGGNRTAPAS
ncbi:MAG: MFS transporter [Clostridia bacterium]|nr:MFS transporter [Clostridia bacterium]